MSEQIEPPKELTISTAARTLGPSAPRKTITARLKSWAWRCTASYVWLHWLLFILVDADVIRGLEGKTTAHVVDVLSSFGFAPVNADYLPRVLRWVWVLLITGFSPLQVALGLPLYIVSFPLTTLAYLLFRKVLKVAQSNPPPQSRPGLRPKRSDVPLATLASCLLLGWLILYGSSSSRRPILVGLALSGVLFVTLAYQAFERVGPSEETDTAVLGDWASRGLQTVANLSQKAVSAPPKTKLEVASALRVNGLLFEKPYRCATFFFRGNRGKGRVALIILAEYVVSLLFLAVSAVLFWAFVMRAMAPPEAISLVESVRMSAAHFLPGMKPPSSPYSLPWWVEFGPATTAWVLFVLYVGPAASALPRQQEDFIRRMQPTYRVFRKITLLWGKYRRSMESAGRGLTT
jgi:hypothetical protein